MRTKNLNLGVLISGRGSNLIAIHQAILRGDLKARIAVVISNRRDAQGLAYAQAEGIDTLVVDPQQYPDRSAYETVIVERLGQAQVSLVILAGYMRLVGPTILNAYPQRVLNIHPALLPAFPGLHAQQQALDAKVPESGCTVHYVDAGMDTGPIIAQRRVPLFADDTEASLSLRILEQEHDLYWRVVEELLAKLDPLE